MLDVMNEDYVRTARAKGLRERQVMTRHVLRNSLIPVITLFGLDFGATIAGTAILTEAIYRSTASALRAEAVAKFELPPIMGVTLFGAFFVVFINALVDIAYAYLDPRVRLGNARPNERRAAALACEDLRSASRPKTARAGGRRRQLRPAAGRGAGHRRRVRLRQERHRADVMGLTRRRNARDRGLGGARRQDLTGAGDARCAGPGRAGGDGLPGPDDLVQPGLPVGNQIVEAIRAHRPSTPRRGRVRVVELLERSGSRRRRAG